jgi:hypothetical protein
VRLFCERPRILQVSRGIHAACVVAVPVSPSYVAPSSSLVLLLQVDEVVDVGASAAAKTQQLLQQQQQEGEEETGPPTNFVGAGKHLLKVFLTDGVSQVSWQTRTGERGGGVRYGGVACGVWHGECVVWRWCVVWRMCGVWRLAVLCGFAVFACGMWRVECGGGV